METEKKVIKKQSGFTLIELIIVIAILGILAAIAVPRLSGFTDKAKVSADEQLGEVIRNATRVLVADGTLTGTGTIDVENSTSSTTPDAVEYTVTGLTVKNNASIGSVMDPLVENNKKLQGASTASLLITVGANQAVTYTRVLKP